jgi:two-component system response regulator AtoC
VFLRGRSRADREVAEESHVDPEAMLCDEVSGLYQAWYFDRRVKDEVDRCSRYRRTFALAVWDLQLLPGEAVPDESITAAGKVVQAEIRTSDLGGRLDRTRFGALLIEASPATARVVAHRVKGTLEMRLPGVGGAWRSGFACFPDDGVDADTLIQVALRKVSDDVHRAA